MGFGVLLGGLAVIVFLAAFIFVPGGASAAEVPVLLKTFGSIEDPQSLAVDQGTGDVYVLSIGSGEVERYTPAGQPDPFTASGSPSYLNENKLTGTPEGGFSFAHETAENQIAVAPPGSAGGTAGDLYVVESGAGAVDVFAPTGAYLGRIYEAGGEPIPGEVCGVAVDSVGNLYIADFSGFVDKFVPAANPLTDADYDSQITGLGAICNIAADSSSLYASTWTRGPLTAYPLSSFPGKDESVAAPAGTVIEAHQSAIVSYTDAVNYANDDVYVYGNEDVAVYHLSNGVATLVESIGAGTLGPAGIGVAVDGVRGTVYVVAGEAIEMYGPPPPIAPVVRAESVGDVTSSSARLRAVIDPELRATQYRFQFGVDQSYGGGELPPAPGGELQGSDLASVQLEGLAPGSTYHYRVVATNKDGTTAGPDRTFTTFQAAEEGSPDGRVWEMVSPLEKNGGGIEALGEGVFQASANGERVTFLSSAAFGAARGNSVTTQYLAVRGPTGWSTQNITPQLKSGSYLLLKPFQAFSGDLSHGLLRNGGGQSPLPISNPPLPGTNAPPGYDNFYIRDNEASSYQALLTSTPTILPSSEFELTLEGFTPDLNHIVVGVEGTGKRVLELNEWADGVLTPVNVGTGGEAVSGAILGSGLSNGTEDTHAISADGSRVFWSVGGDVRGGSGSEPVFVREGIGTLESRTVELPGGEFVDASASGSRALLSTGEVFDVDNDRSLADVTERSGGFVGELGASEDLSRIYFVDTAVLPGAGIDGLGRAPQAGENNLYLYREGAASPRFIGMLAPSTSNGLSLDQTDWLPSVSKRTVRVSPDGESAVFESIESLTGYNNSDRATASLDDEVFVYHAGVGALACASCNPTGEQPLGSASIPAGNITQSNAEINRAYYDSRVLSKDGTRVFFDSPEALVAQDRNGAQDVYEFENDRTRLISSGTGGPATFFDASESGDDVFFTTGNELVSGDTDQLTDLYDARVNGAVRGLAGSQACTGAACQGEPVVAPLFATPPTMTFGGIGNFAMAKHHSAGKAKKKCTRGKRLSRGKCVKAKAKRKKTKAKKSAERRR